jgi:putative SOS response-associated peptidase YedK
MCYNISYLTKKKLDYAKRFGSIGDIADLEKSLDDLYTKAGPVYFVSGFEHPDVPVITNEEPGKIQLFSWGLIPFWVKEVKNAVELSQKTLNARGEDIFEKPSFRNSAKGKRCLVIVDGFFEHHWEGKNSYPFFVRLKNNEPMAIAGLWDSWINNQNGIKRNTFSIITTRANTIMQYIHNKPIASEGSRMPVILPKERYSEWLTCGLDFMDEKDRIKNLLMPCDEKLIESYTVVKLKGKSGVGNSPKAIERFIYPELL